MYKKASWSRTIGFIIRLLLFLGYFIASVTVMTHNLGFTKTQCWVQTTYHQEFLVNVVSNPFLSSLNVLRSAPLSKIERKYYNTSDFMQTISSVFAFPTQIQNALHKAAFLTVYPEPVPLVAADELIMVPSSVPDNAYYFNEQNKTVWSTELGPAANPGAAALARGTLDTMLRISGQPPHAGMQLPNLGRCIQPPDKATLQDKQTVTDWGTSLAKLEHYSQRLGTCLLTGQQTTVDVSSNARTSVLLFSSVNVVFMVGIVLWITASFALFNLGGWIKSDMEFSDATSQEVLQGSRTIDCCSCCPAYSDCCGCWPAYSDEVLMIVAVVWNIVPIFLILDRGYRENNNIPLNNAILAISALLVSILVQWKWANFYVYDVEIHEAVAHNIIMRMQDGRAPGVAVKADRSQPKEGGGAAAAGPQEADGPVGKPVKNAVSFSTVNFLSTASMIRDYGMGHAKSAMTQNQQGGAAVKGGLRRRGRNGPFDEEGAYVHASQPVSRRARMGAAMPYYTALVRTGVPFSQYNYTNLIHKEMFNDSVQSMEYTITTPMLFATLLAAASPDVPTGMVQWAFGCLTASHMLCIPVLYLSQVLSRKKKEPAKTWLPWSYMTGSILLLLAACALLQVAGLLISCIYLYSTYTHYAAPGSIAPIAGGMVAMQFFFVLAVVTSTLTNLTSSPDSTFCCCMSGENFASMMSWLYIMINLFMKMAIGTSLVVNADDRHFAVWGCKTWDGRYQALEEAQ